MYLTANTYSKKFQPFSEKKLSMEGQTTDICVNTYCLRKLTFRILESKARNVSALFAKRFGLFG